MPHTVFQDLAVNFRKDQDWSQIRRQFDSPVTALEWAPDGRYCSIGQADGYVEVIRVDADSLRPCCSIQPSTSRITSVSFNETSDLFASTSVEEKFTYITAFHGDRGRLSDEPTEIRCSEVPRFASFMEDVARGQNVLITGTGTGLKLFDVDSGAIFREVHIKVLYVVKLLAGGVTSQRSWHGCMLAVGVGDKSVQIWDVRVKDPVWIYRPQGVSNRPCFDVDHSNRVLIVADDRGSVTSVDLGFRKEISKKKIMASQIKALRISSSMRFLVSTDGESTNISNFNDPSSSIPSHQLEKPTQVLGIRWHPSDCSFLTRSTEKTLNLWEYKPKGTL